MNSAREPSTRNLGPGRAAMALAHRWARAPLTWVRATKTSSSTALAGLRRSSSADTRGSQVTRRSVPRSPSGEAAGGRSGAVGAPTRPRAHHTRQRQARSQRAVTLTESLRSPKEVADVLRRTCSRMLRHRARRIAGAGPPRRWGGRRLGSFPRLCRVRRWRAVSSATGRGSRSTPHGGSRSVRSPTRAVRRGRRLRRCGPRRARGRDRRCPRSRGGGR